MSSVTAPAPGQSGEAVASVLGEPPLCSPQRNGMMTGHVSQRHVVFDAGLENAVSFQCLRPLLGRSRRQWQGVLGLLVHRTLFYDKLPIKELCREYRIFGKKSKPYVSISRG
jgi:hypothetical protein